MASLASGSAAPSLGAPTDHGSVPPTLARILPKADPETVPPGVAPGLSAGDEPGEITAVQKMLSAISGSLLTGLLGMLDMPLSSALLLLAHQLTDPFDYSDTPRRGASETAVTKRPKAHNGTLQASPGKPQPFSTL